MQNKLEEHGITSSLTDENVLGLDPVSGIELKIFENAVPSDAGTGASFDACPLQFP